MSEFFKVCPICGAHLDPGEKCDCVTEHNNKENLYKEANKNVRNENHNCGA